ncbi:MAG: DUF4375 domain-containing protein [Sphingobacteriaceae bacterium]|nr:MAG: DUF4375 domain-containing protein [Sphingobacteriaceae bacterium]
MKIITFLLNFLGIKKSERIIQIEVEKAVDAFLNRPVYEKLTEEIINNTPDDELVQVVFDNLCTKITDYTKDYETVYSFSEAQQAIYLIWCLEAEVNNGGFNQYYSNPSGQFAELLPDALNYVRAKEFSQLVAKANKVYKDNEEEITKYQDGSLEGFSKSYENNPLEEFDDKFYQLGEHENLSSLQVNFIRKNKQYFIG